MEGTAAFNNIVPFPLPQDHDAPLSTGTAAVSAVPAPTTVKAAATTVRYAKVAVGPVWGPAWIPSKLPGPTADDSSGLDFIDLFDMPMPEVMARVDDAATFRMLGCAQGALHRVPAAAGSPAQPALPAAVNINALTRFRNAWIRNVSPVVAASVRDAMIADRADKKRKAQALLESQKAACVALGSPSATSPSPPAPPPSPSSKTRGGSASIKCRFVSAGGGGEQQAVASTSTASAMCGSGGNDSAEASASNAPASSASASSLSSSAAGGGAVGNNTAAAAAEEQQQAASLSPSASVGVPSSTTDGDLDASQLPQRSSSSHGGCGGRRRGSRGRGLDGAGRQQDGQGSGASWI